jgi:hypothetical protein
MTSSPSLRHTARRLVWSSFAIWVTGPLVLP